MNRTNLLALAFLVAPLAACASGGSGGGTPSGGKPAPATAPGYEAPAKTSAPVSIDARLGSGTAHLTFRFTSPSSGVRISVNGVDGLVVTSAPTLVSNGTFERGSTAEYDVAFTPGEGQSHLAVSVSGNFSGAERAKVETFPVGEPSAAQKAQRPTTQQGGEPVKVLPGDAKQR